jgi:hypothetical protein
MATTALRKTDFATIMRFTVASGQTATKGKPVLLSGSDDEIDDAGADSDLAVGIALETKAAGKECDVYLFGPVVPVLVGTGGATRGTKAVIVADGFTNAPAHNSDGTGNQAVYGIFMQTGAAGDLVGMIPAPSNRGS